VRFSPLHLIPFSQKLDQLKEFGAFEAWSRKLQLIIVWLPSRKNTNFNLYLDDIKTISQPLTDEITDLEEEDLLNLLNHIPEGCKTILIFSLSKAMVKEMCSYAEHFRRHIKITIECFENQAKGISKQFVLPKAK
jgi:RNA polymerase sigma-70 factor (ECF subfamily)